MSAHQDRNDQKSRVADLHRRLQLPHNPETLPENLDELERTLRYLATIDEEPRSTLSRQLITSGITLPDPASLTPAELHHKLWEVIHGLARHRTVLHSTNHLSDLELYSHLWETTLNEPAHELDESMGDCATHIDLLGDGSDESILLHLKYYADDLEREEWRSNFPAEVFPDHVDPPHDRDSQLPTREELSREVAIDADEGGSCPQQAHLRNARTFARDGQLALAHAELDAIESSPEYDFLVAGLEVAMHRLDLFLLEGRWKDATVPGEQLCEFDPENPLHFIKYAHALDQLGQTDHALEVLSWAPEDIKLLPVYYYNSACYEALCGDSTRAIRLLKRACKMDKSLLSQAKDDPALASLRVHFPRL